VSYILKEETFTALAPGYIDGIPNFLHAEVPSHEYFKYKDTATLPNIRKAPELVEKQLIKEDSRDLSQLVDARYADFFSQIPVSFPLESRRPRTRNPACIVTDPTWSVKLASQLTS
jgi:hypothetical protein